MIDIAIVTTAITSRAKPRRDGDTTPEIRKGSIWTRRGDKIKRRCLECLTAAGVRLELEAFFERYKDKSFRLQIVQPKAFDPTIARAVVELVPGPVFDAPHSYRQFSGKRDRAGGAWRFTPFDYAFTPRTHTNFQPLWYVPHEPMTLLKSSAGDGFTYPSADADENDPIESDEFFESNIDPTHHVNGPSVSSASTKRNLRLHPKGFRRIAPETRTKDIK